jgi:Transposase.
MSSILSKSRKFHDTYNDLPKNDYVDSFVIADCLRFGRINKEVYMGEYRYKALQNLTRARFFAVQNLVKEKQRFMNVLFKKYSTMTQEKVFSDDFSTTALAVYDEFESAEALANMDLHELTDFIIEKERIAFLIRCSSQSHPESCPQFLPFTQNGE